jgi:plasmid stabilization system protein ParE
MATLNWTDEAQRWLRDIFDYIAADNPVAAVRTVEGIYETAQVLLAFPEIGHHTSPLLATSVSFCTVTSGSRTSLKNGR